jgi:hypothetical protein
MCHPLPHLLYCDLCALSASLHGWPHRGSVASFPMVNLSTAGVSTTRATAKAASVRECGDEMRQRVLVHGGRWELLARLIVIGQFRLIVRHWSISANCFTVGASMRHCASVLPLTCLSRSLCRPSPARSICPLQRTTHGSLPCRGAVSCYGGTSAVQSMTTLSDRQVQC